MSDLPALKQEILRLTREYSLQAHASFRPGEDPQRKPWESGSPIPYAGRVFTEEEVAAAVGATLDFWLTLGSEGAAMEKELAAFMGVRHSLLVNSGSSANLVAISALTSHKVPAAKRIKPGDEVITVAAGFPTTVAPIVQVGAVPVFIDADPITGNARCDQLEAAYSAGKTKAVMMAHALGNPFDLATTLAFCRKYDLCLVEDNCDALGCSYSMPRALAESLGFSENSPGLDDGPDRVIRWTGTWGDISTQSFYPPHHLTTSPPHDGRRRCGEYRGRPETEGGCRKLPRLGPRLLVPFRHRQHLQQAFRLATGRTPRRLRPQIHLQPIGLQPQAPRSSSCHRPGAAQAPTGVY